LRRNEPLGVEDREHGGIIDLQKGATDCIAQRRIESGTYGPGIFRDRWRLAMILIASGSIFFAAISRFQDRSTDAAAATVPRVTASATASCAPRNRIL